MSIAKRSKCENQKKITLRWIQFSYSIEPFIYSQVKSRVKIKFLILQ